MAVAFDAESNSGATGWTGTNGTTLSWSHSCTGSNRLLLVGAYDFPTVAGLITVTGVTYNGVALTKIGSIAGTDSSLNQTTELWYLIAPATGSNTITITFSGNTKYASGSGMSYTGTDQTTPIDSSATTQSGSSGSAGAASITLTTSVVKSNCWLVGYASTRGGNATAGTGTVNRGQNNTSESSGGDSNATVGTGSQSLVFTTSPSSSWPGAVVASITPPFVAATANPAFLLKMLGN